MNATAVDTVLDAFQQASTGALSLLERHSCIACTRIAVECLKRFDIPARPQSVKFVVTIPSLDLAYASGLSDKEMSTAKTFTKAGNGQWRGHVVAIVEERFLIDGSADDAFLSLEAAGKISDYQRHGALVLPLGQKVTGNFDLKIEGSLDNGDLVYLRYVSTEDHSFLTAPAWETDHIEWAIEGICRKMESQLRAS